MRRYMLVGQTLDGMRVWDILRGVEFIREEFGDVPIVVNGIGNEQKNALVAKLFDSEIQLTQGDSEEVPDYLNFLRVTSWDEVKELEQVRTHLE